MGRRPFYPFLSAFAASCFLGTLATDLAYWRTADIMWADFSAWLVTVGVVVGYVTLVVALVELIVGRTLRPSWLYVLGMVAALILATFNMLVHTRDTWTSVVPWGLVLSAAVVVVWLIATCMKRETYVLTSVKATA